MQYSHMQDYEIIDAVKNGWVEAFDEIINRHKNNVFKAINGMVCNYEDSLDLTQEVFYKAFINIEKYRGDSLFSTWLYRISINISKNYFRKNRRQVNNFDDDFFNRIEDKSLLDANDDIEQRELLRMLYGALDKIDYQYRGVLILKEINQLPYEEISQITGLEMGTVKSRVYRAKEKLKQLLNNKIKAYV
jgi:RNA polymerase sigma-70 factor, ECF subfamily